MNYKDDQIMKQHIIDALGGERKTGMEKIRIFVVQNNQDAQTVNDFLQKLESKNIEYDFDYDFDEGAPGVIVTVSFD